MARQAVIKGYCLKAQADLRRIGINLLAPRGLAERQVGGGKTRLATLLRDAIFSTDSNCEGPALLRISMGSAPSTGP